jgi:signal transduction histidine kinase
MRTLIKVGSKRLVWFVLAVVALIYTGVVLYRSVLDQANNAARVTKTHEVLISFKDIILFLTDVETARRGYVLSGEDRYLVHHTNAVIRLRGTLGTMRPLGQNPQHRANYAALLPLVEERLQISVQSLEAKKSGQEDSALQAGLTRAGAASMQKIRNLVMTMEAEEKRVRAEGQARTTANFERIKIQVFLVSLVSFSIILFVYAMALVEIRRRYLAECDLTLSNKKLEEINRQLDAFGYSVSHDLRAPVRHVLTYTSLLDQTGFSQENLDTVSKITEAAQRMRQLIESLLKLSRMSRADLSRDEVNVEVLVRGVIDELEANKDRVIEWRIDSLPTVTGDPYLLRQVWFNLLSNAVKYTALRKPAQIEVRAERKDDMWEFMVRDNGVGFDMKNAERLFSAFSRLHGDEFDGIGIGLANVWSIVNRHGGRVWADAEVDKGAVFYFTLPV